MTKKEKTRKKAIISTREYNKRAMKAYTFRFHKKNDAAIIEKIEQQESKQGYIKRLVLEDIKKE